MRIRVPMTALLFLGSCYYSVSAQRTVPVQPQPVDAVTLLTSEITNISAAVQAMNIQMKTFLDRSAAGEGTPADRRNKIVAGLQALAAAEQRVMFFQNFQFDLTTKVNDTRNRLSQVEVDLRPQRIDRSVQFEGTTETEELREARRVRLGGERTALTRLMQQLQDQLEQNTIDLREAQILARNLRRTYIPQIEREMQEP